jgi:hypothetical protein
MFRKNVNSPDTIGTVAYLDLQFGRLLAQPVLRRPVRCSHGRLRSSAVRGMIQGGLQQGLGTGSFCLVGWNGSSAKDHSSRLALSSKPSQWIVGDNSGFSGQFFSD